MLLLFKINDLHLINKKERLFASVWKDWFNSWWRNQAEMSKIVTMVTADF